MASILKFETVTCEWCKVVTPHVEHYAVAEGMKLRTVDAEEEKDEAEAYGIMSVPAVVILDDTGAVEKRLVGYGSIMEHIKG